MMAMDPNGAMSGGPGGIISSARSDPSAPNTKPSSATTPPADSNPASNTAPQSSSEQDIVNQLNSASNSPTATYTTPTSSTYSPGGIIGSAMNSPSASGSTATDPVTPVAGAPTISPVSSANATASQVNVAPSQTVSGQLANDLNPNSALIQNAHNTANQASNANGLLNSSIGESAADTAAYNAAIPIAEQDANIYNTDATTNANLGTNVSVDNANAANTLESNEMSNQTSLNNAQTAAQSAQTIAQMNNANSAAMQTQTSIAGAANTYDNWVAQIQQSTIADKSTALATAYQTYLAQIAQLGGNPNTTSNSLSGTNTNPTSTIPRVEHLLA